MNTPFQFIFRVKMMAIAISVAVLVLQAGHVRAATLYENYQTGNGEDVGLYSKSVWVAQTFIASSSHTLKYVQLYGKRDTSLATGKITIAIRATDLNGYPAGPDLSAASELVTTIPEGYGWFNIYLPTCSLSAGTRYAIVVSTTDATESAGFWWSGDTVKGYANGAGFNSTTSGNSWMDGGIDLMFKVYGDATTATTQTGAPTSDSYPGFTDWVGPTQAYTNGDGYARGGQNVYHYYNNYNFSIPAGATINGIEIRLDAAYYTPGWTTGSGRFRVRLSSDHGTTRTALGQFDSAYLTASEATYFVGGPTFTGGRTWSPSDFTNAKFEVQIVPESTLSIVTNPNQFLILDYIPVTVYYTPLPSVVPTVTTGEISGITDSTASGSGNVTSDGGAAVTVRGVCWGTSANPSSTDTCTGSGTGTGVFVTAISGLTPATTYHVRAYATNTAGTAYGEDRTFATNAPLSVMLQGTGSGIIHSDLPDINCSSGICYQSYPFGARITLVNSITGHSLFNGWSGDCSSPAGECTLLMDRSRVVLATFDINPAEAVWVDPGTIYYDTIGNAYLGAAVSGSQIKACRIDYPGNLVFNLKKTVTLRGGYNSDYSNDSGTTNVVGKITIQNGRVTICNLKIK